MKHTKGPWRISGSVMEYKDLKGEKYINRIIVHGLSAADTNDMSKVEMTPCIIEVSGFERSKEERDANARLIAKAPEMLELIEQLANSDNSTCGKVALREIAQRLIAEIEGGD